MNLRFIKKQLIKRLNLSNLLWQYIPNGLYCFNFHRIGEHKETPFDPCVFSCNTEEFKKHLVFLKDNFKIVTIDEIENIIDKKLPINEKMALITFDDGYLDNYELAFPILKSLNIPATFFVTTSLINSNTVPWWDEIAWHIKQCAGGKIKLSNWKNAISINKVVGKQDIRTVLQRFKSDPKNIEKQLIELRKISNTSIPKDICNNLFMSWTQLKEMSDNNMTIGAHSHTHKIFSTLSKTELDFELTESKSLIESALKTSVSSLSYPIGSSTTYNKNMYGAIFEKGYSLAFSFRKVINKELYKNRFELGRFSIDQPFNKKTIQEMVLCTEVV